MYEPSDTQTYILLHVRSYAYKFDDSIYVRIALHSSARYPMWPLT